MTHAKKNKNTALKWLTGLGAIAVLLFGIGYLYSFNSTTMSDDAQVQQLLLPVNARVGGYLQKINFVEFQKVKKGDVMMVLQSTANYQDVLKSIAFQLGQSISLDEKKELYTKNQIADYFFGIEWH